MEFDLPRGLDTIPALDGVSDDGGEFVAVPAHCPHREVGGHLVKAFAKFGVGAEPAPKSITAAPDIEAYLSFVLTMFISFGLAFEVPIVVVVLARLGLVSLDKLKAFRGYFIVLAFIIAAVVTPPDVVSQLALAIPMVLLYEMGIWAAQLFIRHTQAPEETEEKASS